VAQTALAVPFHWGQQERLPGERYLLMDKLLQRYVVHPETGQRDFLWEINRTVPFEIGTLHSAPRTRTRTCTRTRTALRVG
jgi:hypothetical protein